MILLLKFVEPGVAVGLQMAFGVADCLRKETCFVSNDGIA